MKLKTTLINYGFLNIISYPIIGIILIMVYIFNPESSIFLNITNLIIGINIVTMITSLFNFIKPENDTMFLFMGAIFLLYNLILILVTLNI